MNRIGKIFRKYGPAYLKKFADKILPSHRRVIHAISKCRTGELGVHLDYCQQCGHRHVYFHSCSNRSCPQCHAGKTRKWLEKKRVNLLPVPHFHLVFTLPSELRLIVRAHQKELFKCLFDAAVSALFKLMADPKFAGGIPGAIAVLHTWTRDLNYHPHLHLMVPAGTISQDGAKWIPIKKKKRKKLFLVPIAMLSKIFRAEFMTLARKVLPEIDNEVPQSVWKKQWVVYVKPFIEGGQKILQYLARYMFKIAISNSRILSDKDGQITFEYQNSRTLKWNSMTLNAEEFMRRFLQHVLPKGFRKARIYGFFAPKYKEIMALVKKDLEALDENSNEHTEESDTKKYYRRCPECQTGIMVVELHAFFTKTGPRFYRGPPCKN